MEILIVLWVIVAVAILVAFAQAFVKTEEEKRLKGCVFGVAFMLPNGSGTDFEPELINIILAHGGSCEVVNKTSIREILNGRQTNLTFPEDLLLIAGLVIDRPNLPPEYNARHATMQIDFRCFASDGKIFGAGNLSHDYIRALPDDRKKAVQELALELVSRIRVGRVNDSLVVQIDKGATVTLPIKASR